MEITMTWKCTGWTALAILGGATGAFPSDLDLDAVLEGAREAVRRGAWVERELELSMGGTANIYGVDSSFDLCLASDGRYLFETDGVLAYHLGWDGKSAWERERRGPAREQGRSSRVWSQLGQWVHSGYWTDARAGLDIELIEAGDEQLMLGLAFSGEERQAELVLDRSTWLPTELRRENGSSTAKVLYDDYRAAAGVTLAHRIRNITAGNEGTVQIEQASARPAGGPADRYGAGDRRARDTHFVSELAGAIEIRSVPSGHLLVRPLVDGEDIGWFILDTGAGQICIDPKAADGLGLKSLGKVPAVGIAGQVLASFRHGKSLELGPLVIEDPVYVELDLAFLEPIFGLPVAGICGYDVFARAIVELNLDGPVAAVYDPKTYALERGSWTELSLESRIPAIRCGFEGDRWGPFKIDTGASGTVSFHTAAVERLELLKDRDVRAGQRGGVGGMGEVSTGTMDWFEVGGTRYENVSVTFDRGTVAGQADTSVIGTLGSQLLQPFLIVFDYFGRRIALVSKE